MRPDPRPRRAQAPTDSDVDLHLPDQRAETRPGEWALLAVIGAGGVIGAEARYGVSRWLPHGDAAFPWATLLVNVIGCLLLGVLMVAVVEIWSPHRFARPFLGVGVLGGFTTFSTFGLDAVQLSRHHRPGAAILYVVVSVVACLLAVTVGTVLLRRVAGTPEEADAVGVAQ
jgi:CrcB protein